jgi:Protein of unknown function (DUF1295)
VSATALLTSSWLWPWWASSKHCLAGWHLRTRSQSANSCSQPAWRCSFFGSMINSGADIQKSAALRARPGLVTDGFWHLSRNINYFGDLLRYSAFALLSGSPWSWSVVLVVLGISLNRMRTKEASSSRYANYAAYRRGVPGLIPVPFFHLLRQGPLTPYADSVARALGERN